LRCEFPFPGLDFLGRLRRDGYGGGEGQGEQIASRGSDHCFGPPSSREANKDGCTCIPKDTKNTASPHGLVRFCYAWLVLAIAERGIAQLGGDRRLSGIAASRTGLWIGGMVAVPARRADSLATWQTSERLDRHYRPTVTLWGIVDLRCNQLIVLLLTGRWLVGSTLRLTALRS
jgi:hypothetical protein